MQAVIVGNNLRSSKSLKSLCEEYIPFLTNIELFETSAELEQSGSLSEANLIFACMDSMKRKELEQLQENKSDLCAMVLITESEDNAMQAFKHQADGYLIKPIDIDDLIKTGQEIKNRFGNSQGALELDYFKNLIKNGSLKKIALATLEGYTFVSYEDIVRCEAQGNYTNVYFYDGSFLMLTKTLKHYDKILGKEGFVRLHKTHLVNTKYIRTFTKGKDNFVELSDGTIIEVSTRKKEHLLNRLKA